MRFFQGITMPRVLLAALLAGSITYFVLPKLRDADVLVQRSRYPYSRIYDDIRNILENAALAQQDARTAEENILKLADSATNAFQGGPVLIESSPGNFTIEQRDGKIIVYAYDRDGDPWIVKPYPH
jgi:hypothetical protein